VKLHEILHERADMKITTCVYSTTVTTVFPLV
jgi:hypothetical protein